jgi:hypothetical protein
MAEQMATGARLVSIAQASDNNPPIYRAFAAHYRDAGRRGHLHDQPAGDSYLCELDGLSYVVLQNASGVLAVYRVLPTGRLKGLRRSPREFGEAA